MYRARGSTAEVVYRERPYHTSGVKGEHLSECKQDSDRSKARHESSL